MTLSKVLVLQISINITLQGATKTFSHSYANVLKQTFPRTPGVLQNILVSTPVFINFNDSLLYISMYILQVRVTIFKSEHCVFDKGEKNNFFTRPPTLDEFIKTYDTNKDKKQF